MEIFHHLLARNARHDFHAFVDFVGRDQHGRPLNQRPLERLWWDFVDQCQADGVHAGVMLPMGFGKTTQCIYRAAYELGRNPNRLVCLVTDTFENSAQRVALVRRILDCPEYKLVFPHVRVRSGMDERGRFTLVRDGLSKDPSLRAEGVLTGTGVRTDFLLFDDVVTQRNALLEPSGRKRVEEAMRLTWASRTQIDERPLVIWIQTAYHNADAACTLREDPESGWRWLIVRAEDPYEELVWERWERGARVEAGAVACPYRATDLAERARRMGPTNAARGLGNRPVAGTECPFKPEHFEGPEPLAPDAYQRRVFFADPAGDATRLKTGDSDYCAVVALGWRPRDDWWEVYLAQRMRGSPSEQAQFIARMAIAAQTHRVWQEAVRDETMIGVTQEILRKAGSNISVRPCKPTTNKLLRIAETVEPPLASGLLRICGARFPALRNEALGFPAAAHDDLLDALAGAYEQTGGRPAPPFKCNIQPPPEDPFFPDYRRQLERLIRIQMNRDGYDDRPRYYVS